MRATVFPRRLLPVLLALPLVVRAETSKITLVIVDKATGKPMPGRVHLKNAGGKPHRPENLPFWRDHFVCDGEARLDLPAGRYTYEVERGPEFSAARGSIEARTSDAGRTVVTLERLADMAAEGWWSGELHVHRAPGDAEALMRAEDLHVAPFITWWRGKMMMRTNATPAGPAWRQFDGDRFWSTLGGEDEREGGALLYFNLPRPLDLKIGRAHV